MQPNVWFVSPSIRIAQSASTLFGVFCCFLAPRPCCAFSSLASFTKHLFNWKLAFGIFWGLFSLSSHMLPASDFILFVIPLPSSPGRSPSFLPPSFPQTLHPPFPQCLPVGPRRKGSPNSRLPVALHVSPPKFVSLPLAFGSEHCFSSLSPIVLKSVLYCFWLAIVTFLLATLFPLLVTPFFFRSPRHLNQHYFFFLFEWPPGLVLLTYMENLSVVFFLVVIFIIRRSSVWRTRSLISLTISPPLCFLLFLTTFCFVCSPMVQRIKWDLADGFSVHGRFLLSLLAPAFSFPSRTTAMSFCNFLVLLSLPAFLCVRLLFLCVFCFGLFFLLFLYLFSFCSAGDAYSQELFLVSLICFLPPQFSCFRDFVFFFCLSVSDKAAPFSCVALPSIPLRSLNVGKTLSFFLGVWVCGWCFLLSFGDVMSAFESFFLQGTGFFWLLFRTAHFLHRPPITWNGVLGLFLNPTDGLMDFLQSLVCSEFGSPPDLKVSVFPFCTEVPSTVSPPYSLVFSNFFDWLPPWLWVRRLIWPGWLFGWAHWCFYGGVGVFLSFFVWSDPPGKRLESLLFWKFCFSASKACQRFFVASLPQNHEGGFLPFVFFIHLFRFASELSSCFFFVLLSVTTRRCPLWFFFFFFLSLPGFLCYSKIILHICHPAFFAADSFGPDRNSYSPWCLIRMWFNIFCFGLTSIVPQFLFHLLSFSFICGHCFGLVRL